MSDLTPLHVAADEIEAFIAKLDDTHTPCACCGVKRYNNWKEHQWTETLTAAVTKIRRIITEHDTSQ